MFLTHNEFRVLDAIRKIPTATQRQIADETNLSIGTVNAVLKTLSNNGLVISKNAHGGGISGKGLLALEPYRVDNAIIMAAGLSSRFAPISYEKPKGVLQVRGEVLIERQIKQLRDAGIDDIIVVVGYKKEEFFYLEDAFGVKIVVNDEYAKRNNNSTIQKVRQYLGNTFICSSDDYFTENPFEKYVYQAYYASAFVEGSTEEYCIGAKGINKEIVSVKIGGTNEWVMLGHAYWDRAFSSKFLDILDKIYNLPETAPKLWEDIYKDHLDELKMVRRDYPTGVIWEFDSLDEVAGFDSEFIRNVDSDIFDNICSVLKCNRTDVHDIHPINQGLTNLSCRFSVGDKAYVYRHPGDGTQEIINRESEAYSQGVAKQLGLDDTFIYEDKDKGWKISRFIENCHTLDYHNWNEVAMAMEMARILHRSDFASNWSFDIYEEAQKILNLIHERQSTSFKDFKELKSLVDDLHSSVIKDNVALCLCHNDFYDPNFLIDEKRMYLIDWEYSGMSDYATDLGTFLCCCDDYTADEAVKVLSLYFEREPTMMELRHCLAFASIVSFYWFVWALYKDMCGDPVGEWLYIWYRNTKQYGMQAKELYEKDPKNAQ